MDHVTTFMPMWVGPFWLLMALTLLSWGIVQATPSGIRKWPVALVCGFVSLSIVMFGLQLDYDAFNRGLKDADCQRISGEQFMVAMLTGEFPAVKN